MQILVNGNAQEINDGATVATMLETLDLPNPNAVGVEVNGEFVEKEKHAEHTLHANDSVELIQFLGGG